MSEAASREISTARAAEATPPAGTGVGLLGAVLLGAGIVDILAGRLLLALLPPVPSAAGDLGALRELRGALETPASLSHGMVAVVALAMNIAALAAVLRDSSFASAPRRLTFLVLAIFVLPVLGMSLVLRLEPNTVFMALTATTFVGLIGAINTSVKRVGWLTKLCAWLLPTPLVLGYLDTLARVVPTLRVEAVTAYTPALSEIGAEVCAVALGILAPFAFLPRQARRSITAPMAAALLVAIVPALGFGALSVLAWNVTQGLAMRALGLHLALPHGQALYMAALFGYVLTIAFHLWPRRHAGAVQELGLGLGAILLGGVGTYTPFRISLMMLGLLLVAFGIHRRQGLL